MTKASTSHFGMNIYFLWITGEKKNTSTFDAMLHMVNWNTRLLYWNPVAGSCWYCNLLFLRMQRFVSTMILCQMGLVWTREIWWLTNLMQWGGWNLYGGMMQRNTDQKDGSMKMVCSTKRALSNLQPSRLAGPNFFPILVYHHVAHWAQITEECNFSSVKNLRLHYNYAESTHTLDWLKVPCS